ASSCSMPSARPRASSFPTSRPTPRCPLANSASPRPLASMSSRCDAAARMTDTPVAAAAAHPEIRRLGALVESLDVPGPHGTVRWQRLGSGDPLVLLHGGHGSWLHWIRNIEALARRYTVWMPNMPGYLHSADVPPTDGDDDLAPLLDALRTSLDHAVGPDTPIGL